MNKALGAFRERKTFFPFVIFLVLGLVVLGCIFVPTFYSKSFAEGLYEGVDSSKTIMQKTDLFAPEYVIFAKDADKDVTAYFVTLKRGRIIKWTAEEVSYKTVVSPAYFSDEEQEKSA